MVRLCIFSLRVCLGVTTGDPRQPGPVYPSAALTGVVGGGSKVKTHGQGVAETLQGIRNGKPGLI